MIYLIRNNIMEDSVIEIAKFINCTGVLNGKSVREYLNTRFVILSIYQVNSRPFLWISKVLFAGHFDDNILSVHYFVQTRCFARNCKYAELWGSVPSCCFEVMFQNFSLRQLLYYTCMSVWSGSKRFTGLHTWPTKMINHRLFTQWEIL